MMNTPHIEQGPNAGQMPVRHPGHNIHPHQAPPPQPQPNYQTNIQFKNKEDHSRSQSEMRQIINSIYDPVNAFKLPDDLYSCLLYTSPSPRDGLLSRMPSSA
eukprot:TRINITY_DN7167_c0_g1_i3.p2 TRINITY_DN7167_c0_g1~~TRINITY_DN7167_c0_g1_i3.p2  ORF type:complete len:102 (-),score=23.41 TRINITY_DN7167_c0_g1_i3:33-338(-)